MQCVFIYCMHAGRLLSGSGFAAAVAPSVSDVNTTSAPVEFGKYFEQQMFQAGFANREQLAKVSGVDATTIGRWINGQRPPTNEKLLLVAPHLGLRLGDLLVAAGYTPAQLGMVGAPPPPAPPMPSVLRRVMARLGNPRLSERRKAFLLTYIEEVVDKFDQITEQIDEEVEDRRRRR